MMKCVLNRQIQDSSLCLWNVYDLKDSMNIKLDEHVKKCTLNNSEKMNTITWSESGRKLQWKSNYFLFYCRCNQVFGSFVTLHIELLKRCQTLEFIKIILIFLYFFKNQ